MGVIRYSFHDGTARIYDAEGRFLTLATQDPLLGYWKFTLPRYNEYRARIERALDNCSPTY